MRIVSVVGTRPQLIKAAALEPTLRASVDEVLVDTGQHWDEEMAGAFFAELGLPRPDHSLGAGGGSHAEQTGTMLQLLGPILEAERPDAVLVYGDTNSTLAGALAAAKLNIPVAHVEAGLRSFDRSMPEEINRVLADHLARWCFAPTPGAVANLAAEGIVGGVNLVGDLMQDLAAMTLDVVRDPITVARLGLGLAPGGYLFATVHRAENRDPVRMAGWIALLDAVASAERPVVLALHPGTRAALIAAGLATGPHVRVIAPQGYRTTLALQLHAAAVLTDSGGIQRESAWLDVPCLVLRSITEWVEAVAGSGGRMQVIDLDRAAALDSLARLAPSPGAEAEAATRAFKWVISSPGAPAAILAALADAAPAPLEKRRSSDQTEQINSAMPGSVANVAAHPPYS